MNSTDQKRGQDGDQPSLGIVGRPPFQLQSLPVRFRWEVTRRHPYYFQWWEAAKAHYRGEEERHPAEGYIRRAAVAILGSIGVGGEPVDPSTRFEDLGAEQLHTALLSAAVQPVVLRGLAGLLITALSTSTLARLADVLSTASREDCEGEPPNKILAMEELIAIDSAELDCFFNEPIVTVNPASSARQINDAIQDLARQWKAERGLTEQRDRSDIYPSYLEVWDLREGWNGSGYDRKREMTLKDVATARNESISTIHNHYRRAFELIVGHPYSPELWVQVFGVLKLSDLFDEMVGRVSRRRPLVSPTPRPVPETVLGGSPAGRAETIVDLGTGGDDESGFRQLHQDIRELISLGRSNEEIVAELDLSRDSLDAIEYLRGRGGEL